MPEITLCQIRTMTHTYKVTGMTCGSCETKVKSSLLVLPGVTSVEVSKDDQSAVISMDRHIPLSTFQKALDKEYSIMPATHNETSAPARDWLATYKPILLIFAYITVIAIITAASHDSFDWMQAMKVFMAGFFLSFSFFKMLDLKGFAENYAVYDLVAKKIKIWGFVYPFIELALGFAYAANFQPFVTNIVTVVVMTISIIGVLQTVYSKRKIRCACVGTVFNLPMSTVTIIEDAAMIIMSAGMIFALA